MKEQIEKELSQTSSPDDFQTWLNLIIMFAKLGASFYDNYSNNKGLSDDEIFARANETNLQNIEDLKKDLNS